MISTCLSSPMDGESTCWAPRWLIAVSKCIHDSILYHGTLVRLWLSKCCLIQWYFWLYMIHVLGWLSQIQSWILFCHWTLGHSLVASPMTSHFSNATRCCPGNLQPTGHVGRLPVGMWLSKILNETPGFVVCFITQLFHLKGALPEWVAYQVEQIHQLHPTCQTWCNMWCITNCYWFGMSDFTKIHLRFPVYHCPRFHLRFHQMVETQDSSPDFERFQAW